MTNWDMSSFNIGSISGIVVVAMFIVEILKRALHGKKFFECVPVFVYTVAVAVGLTYIANCVLKTADGSPVLKGDTWKLIWAAVMSAAASSGFYTWLRPENVKDAMSDGSHIGGDSMKSKLLILALILIPMFTLMGCTTCPEKALLRESLASSGNNIHKMTKDWADKLTVDPATGKNHADQITPLTQAQHDAIIGNITEFDETVAEDRLNDQNRGKVLGQ